jgi:hypothetical protein
VARVARIHRFRKIFSNGDLAWSVIMEREDTQQRNEREANLRNLIVMPEEQLYAHWRQQMAAHQEIGNLWNLMNIVKAKRAEREQRIRENQIIWTELNFNQIGMSVRSNEPMLTGFRVGSTVITPSWVPMSFTNIGVPLRLHNPQVVAPVRRVQMGRFAALEDDEYTQTTTPTNTKQNTKYFSITMRLKTLRRSHNKLKKWDAVFDKDGKEKVVSFGAKGYSDFTMHKDVTRRARYLKRHSGMGEHWSKPDTPGSLSRWLLWGKPTLRASLRDFRRRFHL